MKRTFIITGISGTLASGIAKKIIESGGRVIGLGRRDPKITGVEFIETDLASDDSIENSVKKILTLIGNEPVFLLNIAGSMQKPKIEKGEAKRVYQANILGGIYLTSLLLGKIKETEGDILNVSSTAGTKGVAAEPIYSSSKWAVRGFTKSLQEQLKNTKCRAIDFAIGGFVSDMPNGRPIENANEWIPAEDAVNLLYTVINVPKSIQISTIIADRKIH